MNKLVKTISLALLLCIPTIYGMENNAIVPISPEKCAMAPDVSLDKILQTIFQNACLDVKTNIKKDIVPNEILQQIFHYVFSDTNKSIRNEAKIIGKLRCLNKYCQQAFNPQATKNMLKWKDNNIVCALIITPNLEKNRNLSHYVKFLADAIKDKPTLYDTIMPIFITGNQLSHAKILLKNGANPNLYDFRSNSTLLKMADHNMAAFKLILQYGGDTNQNSGDGQTIMEIALGKAEDGNPQILNAILQEKKSIHPHYQERLNEYLSQDSHTKALLSILIIAMTYYVMPECTLF